MIWERVVNGGAQSAAADQTKSRLSTSASAHKHLEAAARLGPRALHQISDKRFHSSLISSVYVNVLNPVE